MLINTALDASADDPELAAIVAEELTTLGHFFERTIRAGQADGSIDPTLAARDASATLLSVQIGLRVMSRVMPDRALLEASVRPVLALLRRKPHVAT